MIAITVSTLSQLHSALANCSGGETIFLAGGSYGDFNLGSKSGAHLSYASNVTIKSADPSNPAVFDGVTVSGAQNLTFEGLKFDYEYQHGDASSVRAVALTNVTNVTIRGCTFAGDVAYGTNSPADGYGTGYGLSVRGSQAVLVEDCDVYSFLRGMTFYEVSGLTVRNNEMHSIRSDGMNFSEVRNVLIFDFH